MKENVISALIIISMLILLVSGCGNKKEEAVTEAPKVDTITIEEAKEEPEAPVVEEEIEDTQAEEDTDSVEGQYKEIAGNYAFSSGVGAWGTEVNIDENGAFTGSFHDSNMGDMTEAYPGGTIEICEFNGQFGKLTKVDEFTYKSKIENLEITTPTDTEVIEDEVRTHYTNPYGFEKYDEFEFYLPGKKVSELSEEFLSWTSLRYRSIYPSTLYAKSFYNVLAEDGFECFDIVEEKGTVPESIDIEDVSLLAGRYEGDNDTVMSISIYSDIESMSEFGKISWIEDETSRYQPEAQIGISENGYAGTPEWQTPYTIIVTDNTNGAIVLEMYDEDGNKSATFKMVEHYES